MAFHEILFPLAIGLGSSGMAGWKTEVAGLGSGFEQRNGVWSSSRRSYNVGHGITSLSDLYTLYNFFQARQGRLYGFRFRDYLDFMSASALNVPTTAIDQAIQNTVTGGTTGDGSTKTFQLQKTYSDTASSVTRTIKKPVGGTVSVAVDGVTQSTGWSVSTTTGLVTFTAAPANGKTVSAGFLFDVPVRFDTDTFPVDFQMFRDGYSSSDPVIPAIEIFV